MPEQPGQTGPSQPSSSGAQALPSALGAAPTIGFTATAPAVTAPKGGGAIRGVGEKFGTNPTKGTASMTIPIPASPGREGFAPHLALAYDSGSGNGPFGMGWSLSLPSVTRKTDKGQPLYDDAGESDTFILSDVEDLVPVLGADGTRHADEAMAPGFVVDRYCPRVEGLFLRIERWTELASGEVHWRTFTRDNVVTRYGTDDDSRIVDRSGPVPRIFRWFISEARDAKGNAIRYEYQREDDAGVELWRPHEQNRPATARTANRYVKRVRYGNRVPTFDPRYTADPGWLFEVVFDYGEGHYAVAEVDPDRPAQEQHRVVTASPEASRPWAVRPDPFSTHRSGLGDVRTYRRCERALVFHHVPALDSGEAGYDGLVRSVEFDYADLDGGASVDEQLRHQGSTGFASFIRSVTQSGHVRVPGPTPRHVTTSLPPVEFEYSKAVPDERVRELDDESVENLPIGASGPTRVVDLDGEGLPGFLTEQGVAWFYKPNLGGRLGPSRQVAPLPVGVSVLRGTEQFLDLSGDGDLDLVRLGGHTPGFFERTTDGGWGAFRPFHDLPNVDWSDPGVRFVDLDDDGHADLLVTADDAIVWHRSLGEDGFGPAHVVPQALDEERGPRLVAADRAEAIFLADMCGDGKADVVRVRNGEVCYWANHGRGVFGPKVVLDGSPWFDDPDHFDHSRVRLADVDGSGTSDVIYLGRDGVRLYFNQCGNRLTEPRLVSGLPPVDDLSHVTLTDLLGNGTACVVWSSDVPYGRRPVRYVDLMGGTKPHLLVRVVNNLGAETEVRYAPSTSFYIADKQHGRPWVTRLPFPVHVVEQTVVRDRITGNQFATRYAYHHGYFDGVEREFRGFGMVEQWDTEVFGAATNLDPALIVPPVYTKSWFHTGADVDGRHVSDYFAGLRDEADLGEYYREPGLGDEEARQLLLEDTVLPAGLTPDERREACRALKGQMLRTEVYALDGSPRAAHPYSVAEQNFGVRMLQPRGQQRHAVFLTHPREALATQYERAPGDERIGHTAVLDVDDWGNVVRAVSVAYGRRQPDPELPREDQVRQATTLAIVAVNRVTNAVDEPDAYRTPLPCEGRQYELSGLGAAAGRRRLSYEELDAASTAPVVEAEQPEGLARRLIEHKRAYFRRDDLTGALPLGELESQALPYESLRLALTAATVRSAYGDRVDERLLQDGGYVAGENGTWWVPSGRSFYSPDPTHTAEEELAFARAHFFLPRRYRDPFYTEDRPTESVVSFDGFDLLLQETIDAAGNRLTAGERAIDPDEPLEVVGHDYRVLQPALVMDANRNRTAVAFDALGLVAGTAVMGKPEEVPTPGDRLTGFAADLTPATVERLLDDPKGGVAVELLGGATSRVVYDVTAYTRSVREQGRAAPGVVVTLTRETHVSDVPAGGTSRIQASFAYSDGVGREIQRKLDAEPGPVPGRDGDVAPRWVCSGWTVYNNKGNPVRQFEPFFTDTVRFESDARAGVSPVLLYDPLQRLVATVHPDHSWQKVVFRTWLVETWDVNDTVAGDPAADADVGPLVLGLPPDDYVPTWAALRLDDAYAAEAEARWPDPGRRAAERAAASKAMEHAATPYVAHGDANGRGIVTVLLNRSRLPGEPASEPVPSRTRLVLDVNGNRLEHHDSEGRVVERCVFDLRGHCVHRRTMEGGERRTLADVTGNPYLGWDGRGHRFRTLYDVVRRPTTALLSVDGGPERTIGRSVYGEELPAAADRNARGRLVERYDQAGLLVEDAFDFKGNKLTSRRALARTYDATLDWSAPVELDDDAYIAATRYDAFNRPTQLVAPHVDGALVTVVQPTYNEANLLERLDVWLGLDSSPTDELDPRTATMHALVAASYNAKGQREQAEYGNGTVTSWTFDPVTFRLLRQLTVAHDTRLQDLHYAYDPSGNITSIRDDAQQTAFFRNQVVEPSYDYTYDAAYRLVEATGREQVGQAGGRADPGDGAAMARYVERYVYDTVGALLQVRHRGSDAGGAGWTRDFVRDEASMLEPGRRSNRLSATVTGSVSEAFSRDGDGYDAHGNLLRMPHLHEVRWNERDQLSMVSRQAVAGEAERERTWYVYDAAGERVRKVTEAAPGRVVAERVYLGSFEVYREHGSSGVVRETLHVTDDDHRLAMVETRTAGDDGSPEQVVRYHVANHLQSVTVELDDSGRVISYIEYAPYGTTTYAATSPLVAPARYRFTGKERDEETGLDFVGARYYAAWLGQWISADPAGTEAGVNFYAFCKGNPVTHVDPTGADDRAGQPSGWNRFLGGLKAVGGVLETAAGVSLVAAGVATSEIGIGVAIAAAGVAVTAHGLDTVQSGARTAWSGTQVDSLTSEGLQAAGMSRTAANLTDAGISVVGSVGSGLVTRAPAAAAAVSTETAAVTVSHAAGAPSALRLTNPMGYAVGHTRVGVTLGDGTPTLWTHLTVPPAADRVMMAGGTLVRSGTAEIATGTNLAPRFASVTTVPVQAERAREAYSFVQAANGQRSAYGLFSNDCTSYGVQVLNAAGVTANGATPSALFVSTALRSSTPVQTLLTAPVVTQPLTTTSIVINATTGALTITYDTPPPEAAAAAPPTGTTANGLPDPTGFGTFEEFAAASAAPYSTEYLEEQWQAPRQLVGAIP